MSWTDPGMREALIMSGVTFGGCIGTFWLGKFFATYYTILSYWKLRLEVTPEILRRSFRPYEYNAPCSFYTALPAFTILWPLGFGFMIFAFPILTIDAVWKRWVRNIFKYKKIGRISLIPSWWSWDKLSQIVNKL